MKEIVKRFDERGERIIKYIDRFEFYEKARNAYAIVATTERKLYGCVILKKGVL